MRNLSTPSCKLYLSNEIEIERYAIWVVHLSHFEKFPKFFGHFFLSHSPLANSAWNKADFLYVLEIQGNRKQWWIQYDHWKLFTIWKLCANTNYINNVTLGLYLSFQSFEKPEGKWKTYFESHTPESIGEELCTKPSFNSNYVTQEWDIVWLVVDMKRPLLQRR